MYEINLEVYNYEIKCRKNVYVYVYEAMAYLQGCGSGSGIITMFCLSPMVIHRLLPDGTRRVESSFTEHSRVIES